MTLVLVLLGGALGAPSRYLLDLWVQSKHDAVLPWGTWTVNVLGSLLLGVVAAATSHADAPAWLLSLVGTGVCGALTTFSTFAYESVALIQRGRLGLAAAYVAISVAAGLGAFSLGWALVAVR